MDLTRQIHSETVSLNDIGERFRKWSLSDYPEYEGAVLDFMSGPQWCLLIYGAMGTWKTSLMAAICIRARQCGRSAVFATPELVRKYLHWDADPWWIERAKSYDVLCIDDIVRAVGDTREVPWLVDAVTGLIRHRYDNEKKTIITSDKLPNQLLGIMPRVADLLREGDMIDMGSKSKRKRA